ncbi:MAG: WbqC family protein [Balneolales bacterium]|nr:WbqC family protein [Balneolales bacterium]
MRTLFAMMPSAVPDFQYLRALNRANKFIWITDERFSRKASAHRIKIGDSSGANWLQLPVHSADRKKPIQEVRMDKSSKSWVPQWIRSLQSCYGNCTYFDFFFPEIRADLEAAADLTMLLEVVSYLNNRLSIYLEMPQLHTDHIMRITIAEFYDLQIKEIRNSNQVSILTETRGSYYRTFTLAEGCKVVSADADIDLPKIDNDALASVITDNCCLYDALFKLGPGVPDLVDYLRETN